MTLTLEERSMLRLLYLTASPYERCSASDLMTAISPAGTPYKRILSNLWGKGIISIHHGHTVHFDRQTLAKVINS
jgi:hypothetical protein